MLPFIFSIALGESNLILQTSACFRIAFFSWNFTGEAKIRFQGYFVLTGWRWRWISADSLSSQIPILHEAGSTSASGGQTELVVFQVRWGAPDNLLWDTDEPVSVWFLRLVTPRLLRTPSGLGKTHLFCKNSMLSTWCQAKEDDSACPLPLLENNKICLPFYLTPE